MREFQIIIYGSYGYTGELIADKCKEQGLKVLLSGRNGGKLSKQSEATGFPFETIEINEAEKLREGLLKADLVIHCGGPFIYTAEKMVEACLDTGTNYTDITGEYEVFELLAGYDEKAKEKGILIMPGVGFDVVPTDCMALHLKKKLPDANNLELAFAMSEAGSSRGTSKTMVESLDKKGTKRSEGRLIDVDMGKDVKLIDFGDFEKKAMCIPWGDISTAWRSTKIPNIKVYMAVPEKLIKNARRAGRFRWFFKIPFVKNFLLKKVDEGPAGPSDEKREKGRGYIWGKVTNPSGESLEARLIVPNGYKLTALSSVFISKALLNSSVRTGYFTPAQYFGEELIIKIGESKFI